MSHIQYTLLRSGTYYYNRRVPSLARHIYGDFIRVALSKHEQEASELASRITLALNASWSDSASLTCVNLDALIRSYKPALTKLSEFTSDYLSWKSIDPKPVRLATEAFVSILGDRHVGNYSREDVKFFANHLLSIGNKTTTVRRRINSISAVFSFAYAELELEKRSPASRVLIKGEGADSFKRGTFSVEQLRQGYEEALLSQSNVRLLMPLLGETGCRLAEIVGLREEDICLKSETINIRPHSLRRLKTNGSERELPLVGYAVEAMDIALRSSGSGVLFPRYLKDEVIRATHASNALNGWLKKRFGGLTAHSLRHTMRDRLRAGNVPLEMIDQIGGWSSVNNIGAQYGKGYPIDLVRQRLEDVMIDLR